jgi:peptidoglycan/xylan/chitin deacetylase (PgdA/CDA1 family)
MRIPSAAREVMGRFVRWSGIVGLNYHRIGDGRRSVFDRGLWSATAEEFDRQVRWLKTHFDPIAPSDIAAIVEGKRKGRHVLVTFDDGYADNYLEAFPILKSHRVPGTFFVATGFVDRPRLPWWDEIAWMIRESRRTSVTVPGFVEDAVPFDAPERERAIRTLLRVYKALPSDRNAAYVDALAEALGTGRAPPDLLDPRGLWMTWEMLREMHAGGMTIGGHTVNHPILARMSRGDQASEIAGCERRLKEELGIAMHAFAYPVGSREAFNDDTRACLRASGVKTAFSYYGGFRPRERWDAYDIPRIAVEQETTFSDFRACVSFPWLT